jgi:hypothetical protein
MTQRKIIRHDVLNRINKIPIVDTLGFEFLEMDNGIDFQLSGHTHHGQLWPFNFITKKIYDLSIGHNQKRIRIIIFHAVLAYGFRP